MTMLTSETAFSEMRHSAMTPARSMTIISTTDTTHSAATSEPRTSHVTRNTASAAIDSTRNVVWMMV